MPNLLVLTSSTSVLVPSHQIPPPRFHRDILKFDSCTSLDLMFALWLTLTWLYSNISNGIPLYQKMYPKHLIPAPFYFPSTFSFPLTFFQFCLSHAYTLGTKASPLYYITFSNPIILHTTDKTWSYLFLLTSLNMTSSSFIHVAEDYMTYFLLQLHRILLDAFVYILSRCGICTNIYIIYKFIYTYKYHIFIIHYLSLDN